MELSRPMHKCLRLNASLAAKLEKQSHHPLPTMIPHPLGISILVTAITSLLSLSLSRTTPWLTVPPAAFAQTDDDTCWGHPPNILGTSGTDNIVETSGQYIIVALGGPDTVHALGGDDFICSGPGNDRVFAHDGNDHVDVGTGNNYVRGGAGDDNGIDWKNGGDYSTLLLIYR